MIVQHVEKVNDFIRVRTITISDTSPEVGSVQLMDGMMKWWISTNRLCIRFSKLAFDGIRLVEEIENEYFIEN